jgi:hypothetical protein
MDPILYDLYSRLAFHSASMKSPIADFGEAIAEVLSRGPGPAGFRVHGYFENRLILLTFPERPRLDELDQLGTSYAMSKLKAMRGQSVTGGLPFLTRPRGQEFKFVVRQLHGAPSST